MALSIFADALPYSEMVQNYKNWLPNMQLSELQPNIAYSSSLHWQLYCDKYPDDRKTFVDWGMVSEKNRAVRIIASIFTPFDRGGIFSIVTKKGLDRVVFRRNAFANIPMKFRKDFSEIGQYLFWDKEVYGKEPIFDGFLVISQDEGHISFDEAIARLEDVIGNNEKNIMFVTGFPDQLGHKTRRGDLYSKRLAPYMDKMRSVMAKYNELFPEEEILLVSDHGMSTIESRIDLGLEARFGKQSKNTYIAYSDSCVMCIWSKKSELLKKISDYLNTRKEGHLLSDEERIYYRATDQQFGNLIYILREGTCFANSWFGKSLRKPSADGEGMHGFWPERSAKDQMASVVMISKKRKIDDFYTYSTVHALIKNVMQGK